MQHTAAIVDTLNKRLRTRFGSHLQVGHSYFMRRGLNEDLLEQIWQADIMPFLEDQLFGKEDELAAFRLEAIRRADAPEPMERPELIEGEDAADQAPRVDASD